MGWNTSKSFQFIISFASLENNQIPWIVIDYLFQKFINTTKEF